MKIFPTKVSVLRFKLRHELKYSPCSQKTKHDYSGECIAFWDSIEEISEEIAKHRKKTFSSDIKNVYFNLERECEREEFK